MPNYHLLYSTNTLLAYFISQKYYNGEHWFYCSPHFDSDIANARSAILPPSSAPKDIYCRLHEDVENDDLHSANIQQNKAGLKRGVVAQETAGKLTPIEAADIMAIIDAANTSWFKPLLYLIPYGNASARLKPVPINQRASLLSDEYIIEWLSRDQFDVVPHPRR